MALRVINALTRGICGVEGLSRIQPVLSRSYARRRKEPEIVPEGESIDAILYKDDIPETVLVNREKHLPDKKESPFKEHRRQCVLCRHNITPDYKNVRLLSQFVSGFSGVIYGKHITGLCAHRQTQVEREIAKSRKAGLMPYTYKMLQYHEDPKLFDAARPIKPHPYF